MTPDALRDEVERRMLYTAADWAQHGHAITPAIPILAAVSVAVEMLREERERMAAEVRSLLAAIGEPPK